MSKTPDYGALGLQMAATRRNLLSYSPAILSFIIRVVSQHINVLSVPVNEHLLLQCAFKLVQAIRILEGSQTQLLSEPDEPTAPPKWTKAVKEDDLCARLQRVQQMEQGASDLRRKAERAYNRLIRSIPRGRSAKDHLDSMKQWLAEKERFEPEQVERNRLVRTCLETVLTAYDDYHREQELLEGSNREPRSPQRLHLAHQGDGSTAPMSTDQGHQRTHLQLVRADEK